MNKGASTYKMLWCEVKSVWQGHAMKALTPFKNFCVMSDPFTRVQHSPTPNFHMLENSTLDQLFLHSPKFKSRTPTHEFTWFQHVIGQF